VSAIPPHGGLSVGAGESPIGPTDRGPASFSVPGGDPADMARANDILFASEAALRLVDTELSALCDLELPDEPPEAEAEEHAPALIETAASHVDEALITLRETRASLHEDLVMLLGGGAPIPEPIVRQLRQASAMLLETEARLREATGLLKASRVALTANEHPLT